MLMTEAQARERWCPFSRVLVCLPMNELGGAVNRFDVDDEAGEDWHRQTRCIANECMAWRWGNEPRLRGESYRGYCGLAGTGIGYPTGSAGEA